MTSNLVFWGWKFFMKLEGMLIWRWSQPYGQFLTTPEATDERFRFWLHEKFIKFSDLFAMAAQTSNNDLRYWGATLSGIVRHIYSWDSWLSPIDSFSLRTKCPYQGWDRKLPQRSRPVRRVSHNTKLTCNKKNVWNYNKNLHGFTDASNCTCTKLLKNWLPLLWWWGEMLDTDSKEIGDWN